MTAGIKTPAPISASRRQARLLRIAAAVVLLLGIFGADAVYWMGMRSTDLPDDASMMGNEKAQSRQAQILYGNQAVLVNNWTADLKQPGTQAVIMVVTAALGAGGCFYFAHLLHHAEEQTDEKR
jgi:hypothetical protein